MNGQKNIKILREDFICVIKLNVQSEKLHNIFDICLYEMQTRLIWGWGKNIALHKHIKLHIIFSHVLLLILVFYTNVMSISLLLKILCYHVYNF